MQTDAQVASKMSVAEKFVSIPSATYRMKQERKLAVCYVFVYIFCLQIITTNTRTSTLWKLNTEQGKIVSVPAGGVGGAARVRSCHWCD